MALSGAALAGCAFWRQPTPIPMELLADDRACAAQAPVLLVLLPGAHMTPAEMQAEGMVDAVRQRRLAVDVLVAGAALDYVYDGTLLRRLHQDVIAPYRARGYRRIWLAGISLGGFVAMGYAMQHPGEVEGIVALAPYLGRRPLVQEIADAGGASRWDTSQVPRPDDLDQKLWRWLARPPAGAPALHLGYGREDRFAPGHQLLAQLLPAQQVRTAPGGHDWPPWRQLWAEWLDAGLLPTACPA
jgi:pimeloyl-ACP methyl ester carboxylesterase